MSEQIDWSKAPEGATHYVPARNDLHHPIWLKMDGNTVLNAGYIGHSNWAHSYTAASQPCTDLSNAIKRPTTPSWSGEGLPPVGTVLEAIDKEINGGTWSKMVVLAVGKHGKDDCLIVAEVIEGQSRPGTMVASLYTGWERSFRPIRTHEEIAADEREAAVNGMLCYDALGGSRRGLAEALYDAGYRKEQK